MKEYGCAKLIQVKSVINVRFCLIEIAQEKRSKPKNKLRNVKIVIKLMLKFVAVIIINNFALNVSLVSIRSAKQFLKQNYRKRKCN